MREILVSGLREFLSGIKISVPVSHIAKFKTTCQIIALAFLILYENEINFIPLLFIGKLALWMAAILTLYTGYIYFKKGIDSAIKEDNK